MSDRRRDKAKTVRPKIAPRRGVRGQPGAATFPVVGIGASAGGLEACIKLMDALPATTGMAFILIQHLDPAHKSMMADLLAGHTAMTVRQAEDGTPIEPEHLYVIPPGSYLSVSNGALRLTPPAARHGARLPFDFLLHSMAEECGSRAVGIVLSGTGADGCLGLQAVKQHAGFVLAQDPAEAGYDGMPRSVIATGVVDRVLGVADMPAALLDRQRRAATPRQRQPASAAATPTDWLAEILDLVQARTAHDFTHYKSGTLLRRIERRMSMIAIAAGDMARYFATLQRDGAELDRLVKDLLINVTRFFRDAPIFRQLEDTVLPDLLRGHDEPRLRSWVVGCSTGEEAYSLAMLFREQIELMAKGNRTTGLKLQVFASDADADAVAVARDGLYPATIEADVSSARLARFFIREDQGYRVVPELRASIVFTVQDVLTDPPFSRLDFVSCRNLLIYLGVEAQARVISLFHFALRERGVLLLGSSETAGEADGRFEILSKPGRLFRRIGRGRPGDLHFGALRDDVRLPARSAREGAPSRQSVMAGLCSRFLLESHAPATILINHRHEYLYSVGPTERYLRVAPGPPTNDLLAMIREDTRIRLRAAVRRAIQENARVVVPGGRTSREGRAVPFEIEVQPILHEDEKLLLICFIDTPRQRRQDHPVSDRDAPRVAALEKELEITRAELQSAVRDLELSDQEQKAINEEALSSNEEFQSTNEELLTSQEELQSLNEELTALNSQLQETLEQQRTTSNDLQNVLYSTDVATLFLDTALNIRFFTPATKALFNVIEGDVGRPLADLHSLAADSLLPADARDVLRTLAPIEREIEGLDGVWFRRRILPYRTHESGVEGVVITFHDITTRKHAAKALEIAKQQAELANTAKSRFLAAASHDLRQPLQTLTLLQGLLAKNVEGEKAARLVARLDETIGAMTGMLNTLLDINQIEAGVVRAEMTIFSIGDLLDRLRKEFHYHAQAQNLSLRVVPCGLMIYSDPRLLEQMIRNLLSNALKYTRRGKVLLGCRRHGEMLSVEVWDTGVGIPDGELKAIFEEYHQLDNAARERSRGLGLGLSIVQRLGVLLGHRVRVHSRRGQGSVFAIEIALPAADRVAGPEQTPHRNPTAQSQPAQRTGAILVVEDDPKVRDLIDMLLTQEGHRVTAVADGVAALGIVANGAVRPDLILSDYNLPGGMDGLAVVAKLRDRLQGRVPVIILTGDISADTLRAIARHDCVQLNKPVKPAELTRAIDHLLAASLSPAASRVESGAGQDRSPDPPAIFIVDDDSAVRAAIRAVLEDDGHSVEDYAAGETFLEQYRPGRGGCLLIDAYLPGMNGLALLQRLRANGDRLPAIMITGNSDVPMAVQAMKAGASDFIEKPISAGDLLASLRRALEQSRDARKLVAWRENAKTQIDGLTIRQRDIMDRVLAGHPSKNIAADLGISQRTVENHRASIMRKTGTKSLPELARLALAAAATGIDAAG